MDMPRTLVPQALAIFYAEVLWVGAACGAAVLAAALLGPRPSSPAPGAGPPSRRLLLYGLGGLWVLDGLLQLQPGMVTSFIGGVIGPLLQGQPGVVAALLEAGARLWWLHPITWNVAAVYVQVGTGLGLVLGREDGLRRTALWVSLLWAVVVWIFGEGLGGVLSGGSWLSGAPGSAFLYAAASVLLLLPVERWAEGAWLRPAAGAMAAFWLAGAVAQAWPPAGYWARGGLQGAVQSMAAMAQPAVFAAPLSAFARLLGHGAALWNAAFVGSELALAAAWWRRPWSRATQVWTAAWALGAWWLFQDFGVLGGMGTDPNAGPVLALLVAVLGRARGECAAAAPAGTPRPRFVPAGGIRP